MMKHFVKISLIALALLTVIVIALFSHSNRMVPELGFVDIDGQQHHFSEYKGRPTLVIFWATDCPGCIKETPDLIALYDEYASKGLNMLGIAMPHDKPDHIKAMREQKKLPYLLTWDQSGELAQAFDNVRVTPTHFLISAEGEIVMRKIGALNIEQLKQRLALMGIGEQQT